VGTGVGATLEVSKVVLVELRPVLESIGKIGSGEALGLNLENSCDGSSRVVRVPGRGFFPSDEKGSNSHRDSLFLHCG